MQTKIFSKGILGVLVVCSSTLYAADATQVKVNDFFVSEKSEIRRLTDENNYNDNESLKDDNEDEMSTDNNDIIAKIKTSNGEIHFVNESYGADGSIG